MCIRPFSAATLAFIFILISALTSNAYASPKLGDEDKPPEGAPAQEPLRRGGNSAPSNTSMPMNGPTVSGHDASPTVRGDLRVKSIAAGSREICAVLNNGNLRCWPSDLHQNPVASREPEYIVAGPPRGKNFKAIFMEGSDGCALRTNGSLACWGNNRTHEAEAPNSKFIDVAFDNMGTRCGIRLDGSLEGWGFHFGPTERFSSPPPGKFRQIVLGFFGVLYGLRADGSIVAWRFGPNASKTPDPPNGRFVEISGDGGFHFCARRADGTATCWGGDNEFGQKDVPPGRWNQIYVHFFTTCGVRVDGTVACWGLRSDWMQMMPKNPVDRITLGGGLACALFDGDRPICWGQNPLSDNRAIPDFEFRDFGRLVVSNTERLLAAPRFAVDTFLHDLSAWLSASGCSLLPRTAGDITSLSWTGCGGDIPFQDGQIRYQGGTFLDAKLQLTVPSSDAWPTQQLTDVFYSTGEALATAHKDAVEQFLSRTDCNAKAMRSRVVQDDACLIWGARGGEVTVVRRGQSDCPSAESGSQRARSQARPHADGATYDLLTGAITCVDKDHLARDCSGYAQLSQAVNARRHDPAVVESLLTAAEGQWGTTKKLSLSLLARPFPDEGDEVAARLLKLLVAERDPDAMADLLEALAPRSVQCAPERALTLLRSAEAPGVRAAAARLLGDKAHEAAAEQSRPALLRALREDLAPPVRRNAAIGLGNLKYGEALPDLIRALDDQLVAPSAVFAIARFDVPEAYDAIWSRIEAMVARPDHLNLPLLASVSLLEKHPRFDSSKVLLTLEKLKRSLNSRAQDDTVDAARKMVQRSIDRISGEAPGDQ